MIALSIVFCTTGMVILEVWRINANGRIKMEKSARNGSEEGSTYGKWESRVDSMDMLSPASLLLLQLRGLSRKLARIVLAPQSNNT